MDRRGGGGGRGQIFQHGAKLEYLLIKNITI